MAAKKKQAKKAGNPHVLRAESYISGVISGKIPACKWIKLACERHKRDVASSITRQFPYRFDAEMGARVCRFIEYLPHTKGKWAKKDPQTGKFPTIFLEGWQCFFLISLFGWVRKDNGKRRFRKARLYVPRKNAKTTLLAAVGLYMLCADREPGAEVYCGATSEQQAKTLFQMVRQMCLKRPELVQRFGLLVNVASIIKQDGSVFKPVIGKPGDGDSPHCAIIDEYHEHATSDQLDTMETGMGAREHPMSIIISTAGSNPASPCRDDWKNCERILEGIDGFVDDTTFCLIYATDKDDRWDSEESLRKANPNWGISIEPNHMLADMRDARARASQQSKFRTKHLNEWVSVKEAFFNSVEWAKLERPIKREDFKDRPCFIGADFAFVHDLVAIVQLFSLPEKRYAVFGKYFLPENTIDLPENQHYRNWRISGHLEKSGDSIIDEDVIIEELESLCSQYEVSEIPFDPYRSVGLMGRMERQGLPVVEYRNTVLMMSGPMKELDALIRSGRIVHDGDPVLAWAIGNVTGRLDKKDNVYPNKEAPQNKIDPVVGLLMALGRAMARGGEESGPMFDF
jgi:phage terminase large subunit-like protein